MGYLANTRSTCLLRALWLGHIRRATYGSDCSAGIAWQQAVLRESCHHHVTFYLIDAMDPDEVR